jgi:hypothetical protein
VIVHDLSQLFERAEQQIFIQPGIRSVLVANSVWRSRLKNLWRILCESFSSSLLV